MKKSPAIAGDFLCIRNIKKGKVTEESRHKGGIIVK